VKPYPAEVTWIDAWRDDGEYDLDDMEKKELVIVKDVGWVVRRDKRVTIVVAALQEYRGEDGDDTVRQFVVIPSVLVQSVKRLHGGR
jgi:hypothetical protein